MTKKIVGGIDLSALSAELNMTKSIVSNSGYNKILLDDIIPDPDQPRKSFDQEALEDLASSIKERGVLQPIIVTAKDNTGKHRILMGERRWRASKIAEAKDIPAIVREEVADIFDQVIENIQREDLAHSDIAHIISDQIKKGMKSKQIAKTLGKHESWVSRYRNFFELADIIRERVDEYGMVTAQVLQKAYETDQDATIAFMLSHESITRRQAEDFQKNLSAPPSNAFSDDETIPSFDATQVSPFGDKPREGKGGASNDNGSQDSEASYGIGESKAAKKPKYAALVSVKKRPGSLGRLLTDRLASKEEYAAVSFDGEVIEFPTKEIKLVSISAIE